MLLRIEQSEREYAADRNGLSELLSFLEDYEDNSKNILVGFKVNGEEVYDDLKTVLEMRLSEVEEVEVLTETPEDHLKGMLLSSYDYIENAKRTVMTLSKKFYLGGRDESWSMLSNLMDGIGWLMQTAGMVDHSEFLLYLVDREVWNRYYVNILELGELLGNIISAAEIRDTVLIADYLRYEAEPVLGKSLLELENLLS